MIKLSRMADYGIVLMGEFSASDMAQINTAHLVHATRLPAPTVSKLLKLLTHSGLLRSTRGSQGGYTLTKPASAITIAEVIEAIDGPIALTVCTSHADEHCEIKSFCPMRPGWQIINAAVRQALAEVTLEDISRHSPLDGSNVGAPPLRGSANSSITTGPL